ncbi:MAG: nucleotidyltransferase domain-containing protein, partial [Anaerolineae bacterium]
MAFDTTLLDQAIAQRRAKAEIARRKTLADALNFLEQWGTQYGIRRACLFGSVTRPHHFTQDSDVDLAVEMNDNRQLFEAMSRLALAL